jgi:hypothetical protein
MQLQTILYAALIVASVSLAAPAPAPRYGGGGAGGGISGPDGISGAGTTNQMNEAHRLVGQITSQVEGQAYKPRTAAEAVTGQRNFDPSHRFDLVNSGTPGRRDPSPRYGNGGNGGGISGPDGVSGAGTTNQMNEASGKVGQITSATEGQAGERNWVGRRDVDQAVPGNSFAHSIVNQLSPAAKVAGTGGYRQHGYSGYGYGYGGRSGCYPRGYDC